MPIRKQIAPGMYYTGNDETIDSFDQDKFNSYIANKQYSSAAAMMRDISFTDENGKENIEEMNRWRAYMRTLETQGEMLERMYANTMPNSDLKKKVDADSFSDAVFDFQKFTQLQDNDLANTFKNTYNFFGNSSKEIATKISVTFKPEKRSYLGIDGLARDNDFNINRFYQLSGLDSKTFNGNNIDVVTDKEGNTTLSFAKDNPLANKILYTLGTMNNEFRLPNIDGSNNRPILTSYNVEGKELNFETVLNKYDTGNKVFDVVKNESITLGLSAGSIENKWNKFFNFIGKRIGPIKKAYNASRIARNRFMITPGSVTTNFGNNAIQRSTDDNLGSRIGKSNMSIEDFMWNDIKYFTSMIDDAKDYQAQLEDDLVNQEPKTYDLIAFASLGDYSAQIEDEYGTGQITLNEKYKEQSKLAEQLQNGLTVLDLTSYNNGKIFTNYSGTEDSTDKTYLDISNNPESRATIQNSIAKSLSKGKITIHSGAAGYANGIILSVYPTQTYNKNSGDMPDKPFNIFIENLWTDEINGELGGDTDIQASKTVRNLELYNYEHKTDEGSIGFDGVNWYIANQSGRKDNINKQDALRIISSDYAKQDAINIITNFSLTQNGEIDADKYRELARRNVAAIINNKYNLNLTPYDYFGILSDQIGNNINTDNYDEALDSVINERAQDYNYKAYSRNAFIEAANMYSEFVSRLTNMNLVDKSKYTTNLPK